MGPLESTPSDSPLRDAIARRKGAVAPLDAAALDELTAYHRDLAEGLDATAVDATRARVELLGRPDTLAVVTGQQAGLLGGPLYAFVKAASALALARHVEQASGRPTVAVFWIAGDDHDFDEIRRVAWLDAEGALQRFEIAPAADDSPRVPAYERRFAAGDGERLAGALEASTRATDFRGEILDLVRALCREGETFERQFGRLMSRLFEGTGLVFVAPRLDFVRREGAHVLRREIKHPLATTQRVREAGARATDEGGTSALHRPPEAVNLFVMRGRERCRVHFVDGAFQVEERPGEWVAVAPHDFATELRTFPERFSPNVVTRPVVQDAVFPTVAYVAGPGEAAYFRELVGVYEEFGVAMPWIARRPSITLVEPRVRRSLERFGVSAEEVMAAASAGDDGGRLFLAAHDPGDGLRGRIDALGGLLADRTEAIRHAVPTDHSRTRGSLDKLSQQVARALDHLREAAESDAARASAERVGHFAKAAAALRPEGVPQERVLGVVAPFLVNYGWEFARRLRDLVPAAGAGEASWRLDLPLTDDSRPMPLSTVDPAADLWRGAGI